MASYKVPQDVEAEDKLLGPLSFRQFIYLVIAIMFGGLGYFLALIFVPLVIIPAPFAIVFLVLSLPLKKDQPMEIYIAALLSFYFKPRRKIWEQDGIISLVEFTNDLPQEQSVGPDISFEQAKQQISFLSGVVDSNGMIIRNQLITNPSIQSEVLAESTQVEDIHDEYASVNQNFDQIINQQQQTQRQQIINQLQQSSQQQDNHITPNVSLGITNNFQNIQDYQKEININISSSDYKSLQNMSQSQQTVNKEQAAVLDTNQSTTIIEPIQSEQPTIDQSSQHSQNTYTFSPTPDIINLANNDNLSIQTIAAEAKKINQRRKLIDGENEEVVISLK